MKKTAFLLTVFMFFAAFSLTAFAENVVFDFTYNAETPNYFIDTTGLTGSIAATAYGDAVSNSYLMRVDDNVLAYLRCNPTGDFGYKQPSFRIDPNVVNQDLTGYREIEIKWAADDASLLGKKTVVTITTNRSSQKTFELTLNEEHLCDKDFEISKTAQSFSATTLDISDLEGTITEFTIMPFRELYDAGGNCGAAKFYLQSIELIEGNAASSEQEDGSAGAPETSAPLLAAVTAAVIAGTAAVYLKKRR